jgi:hypothetical protein
MAVGDVVNDVGTNGVSLTFQPASNVEICITNANWWDGYAALYDGVNIGRFSFSENTNGNPANVKLFITNTHYLYFPSGSASLAPQYSGIQIK